MIDPRAPLATIIQLVKEKVPSHTKEELLDALYCQGLTTHELSVIDRAGEVMMWFAKLDMMHPKDVQEVEFHVHAIQNIVMARAAQRAHPDRLHLPS